MKPLLSELLNKTLNEYQVELKEKQDLISKYKLGEIGVEQLPKQSGKKENRKEVNPQQDKESYTKELATVIADSLILQIVYNLAHYDYHEMWYSVPCTEALKYSEITKERGNGWGITVEHACGEPYLSLRQLIDLEPKDKAEFDLCYVQLDAFKKKFDYHSFHYGVIERFREYGICPIRPKLKNGEEASRLSMYFGLYEEETKQEDLYKAVKEVLKLRSLVGDVSYEIECLIEDSLVVLEPDCIETPSNPDKENNVKEDLINTKKVEYEKPLQEIQSDNGLNTIVSKVESSEPVKVIKPIRENNPVMVMFLFGMLLCCVSILALYFMNQ